MSQEFLKSLGSGSALMQTASAPGTGTGKSTSKMASSGTCLVSQSFLVPCPSLLISLLHVCLSSRLLPPTLLLPTRLELLTAWWSQGDRFAGLLGANILRASVLRDKEWKLPMSQGLGLETSSVTSTVYNKIKPSYSPPRLMGRGHNTSPFFLSNAKDS